MTLQYIYTYTGTQSTFRSVNMSLESSQDLHKTVDVPNNTHHDIDITAHMHSVKVTKIDILR